MMAKTAPVRKPRKKLKPIQNPIPTPPEDVKPDPRDYRVKYYKISPRFLVMRSVVNKWGLRREALLEVEPDFVPIRIDPRIKGIKHILKVWQFLQFSRKKGNAIYRMQYRITVEQRALIKKLDRIWPLHFAAKELKGRVLYLPRITRERDVNWLLRTIKALLPQSKRWLAGKGYITITYEDGSEVIRLTEAGAAYFARNTKQEEKSNG